MPADAHLWNIVKTRCTPLGSPRASSSMVGYVYAGIVQTEIDLHNMTLQEAHAATQSFIDSAAVAGRRTVTVITGRSGEIRREFPVWAELHPKVRRAAEMNGGGAFSVSLKKR